jgi:hypothetical protein
MAEKNDTRAVQPAAPRGGKLKVFLGKIFLENNQAMSYVNGFITATGIYLLVFQQLLWPIITWLAIYFTLTVIRSIYWFVQVRMTDRELKRIETELAGLNREIEKRKAYFESLRKQKGA